MKKLLYLTPVLVAVVSFYIHSLYAQGNPPIEKRFKIKSGAVQEVQINGEVVSAEDLTVVLPDVTYRWTEEMAEEGTRSPNVGPGLENK